jgi:hypothetical protein
LIDRSGWTAEHLATSADDMTMHFHAHARATSLLVLLGLLAPGCDLGPKSIADDPIAETGDEAEGDTGEGDTGEGDTGEGDSGDETGITDPAFGSCGEESESIVTDFDALPPGFAISVNELLEQVSGDYAGTLSWYENDGLVTNTHANTVSDAQVRVEYLGGEVRLTEVERVGLEATEEPYWPCSNRLEVDARIEFTTADGVLAEVIEAPVVFLSHEGEPPSVQIELDLDMLQGSLSADDFTISNDGELYAAYLMLSLPGPTIGGGVSIEVLVMEFIGYGGAASLEGTKIDPMP